MNAEPDEPEESDELNIDNAERRTWLLKIPNALHEVGARLGPAPTSASLRRLVGGCRSGWPPVNAGGPISEL
jgi:hypothetical protein